MSIEFDSNKISHRTMCVLGQILSRLPVILITLITILIIVGLFMLFLIRSKTGQDLSLLFDYMFFDYDLIYILGIIIIGILMIAGMIGFSKRKVWAWKLLVWFCWSVILTNLYKIFFYYYQHIFTKEYVANAGWFVFCGAAGLYFLNRKKVKEQFKRKISE